MQTGGSPGLSLKSTPSKIANNFGAAAQERNDKQNQIKAQEARDTASKLAIEVNTLRHYVSLLSLCGCHRNVLLCLLFMLSISPYLDKKKSM